MRLTALLAVALAGCAARQQPKPCQECRLDLAPPKGPFLTNCFAESLPYDTDFGCSQRPSGPALKFRFRDETQGLRIDQLIAYVGDVRIFDSNLPLVLSRDAFPVATLAPQAEPPDLRIVVKLAGLGIYRGYKFELRSSHRLESAAGDVSFTLHLKPGWTVLEEAIAGRWEERAAEATPVAAP